jgi:hypothetical protein
MRTSGHLNKEALLRWQMRDANEAERAHVATCTECQAQAKPLDDALSWFGAAARQWGEEKAAVALAWREGKAAAAMDWQESKIAAARNWRGMVGVWATVSVALLLIFGIGLGIGLPRWNAHRAAIEAQVHQQQLLQGERQDKQELARDNALLDQVDQDVSQEVPQAMQPLSWSPASSGSASPSGGTASRQ